MTALVPWRPAPAIAAAYAARGYPSLQLELHRAFVERRARTPWVAPAETLPRLPEAAPRPISRVRAPAVPSPLTGLYTDAHAILDWLEAGSPEHRRPPRSPFIKAEVCREFGISLSLMISSDRHGPVARARQVALWLHHKLRPGDSLLQIGRLFTRPVANGFDRAPVMTRLDHTTVLHAIRKVRRRVFLDDEFAARVEWVGMVIVAKAWAGGGT